MKKVALLYILVITSCITKNAQVDRHDPCAQKKEALLRLEKLGNDTLIDEFDRLQSALQLLHQVDSLTIECQKQSSH